MPTPRCIVRSSKAVAALPSMKLQATTTLRHSPPPEPASTAASNPCCASCLSSDFRKGSLSHMQGASRVRHQDIGLHECLTSRGQPRLRRHHDTPLPVVDTDII